MDSDFLIVFGILAILISFVPLLNSFSRGERPGVWAVLLIAGFGMVAVALVQSPSGYSFETLPAVFQRVFSNLI